MVMSSYRIENVRIAGFAAAVPDQIIENKDSGFFSSEEAYRDFVENVGIERRRVLPPGVTCSDLCLQAAEELISQLGWKKDQIGLLIFVSQSADYILPATSCILQARLGLPESTMCLDISSGCSGWVLGLSTAASLVLSGGSGKALLLVGDASPNLSSTKDKSHGPLFSPSGTATAIEFSEGAPSMIFKHQTDGTGYEAIIKRYGGSRHPFCVEALEVRTDANGLARRGIDTQMDGTAVYVFGITRVPKAIKGMLEECSLQVEDVDLFLFHQANMMMNEKIRKKCGIPPEKCPYSLRDFGNNSSGSIPLTVVTQLSENLPSQTVRTIASGFGVGLSWSTVSLVLDRVTVVPLVQILSSDADRRVG
jgi:3-oxoacyl-[acyl-carrier-protein] synthase-3